MAAAPQPGKPAPRWLEPAVVFLVYGLVALFYTWPVITEPAVRGVRNVDYYINTWVLAWVVHQATTDPLHLFDANVFHPAPASLAYNESLLPQALLAAPVLLLGGSPVLAHNFSFFLTFPLSGLGAYLLARELSGSREGAFLAGFGFAFCAFRFHWINNIQCSSIQWLPFALLFLSRALRRPGLADAVRLGLAALAQALSSGYFALLLAPTLTLAFLHELRGLPLRDPALRPRVLRVVAAVGLAAGGAALVSIPYLRLSDRDHLVRAEPELVHWSARPTSFLNPGRFASLPHHEVLSRIRSAGDPLYPGLVVGVLAVAGAVAARRSRGAQLALLLALTGAVLALGPRIAVGPFSVPGPFGLLMALPGGQMVRTPARLGILALLGLALLAACGFARLVRPEHARRVAAVLALLALVDMHPSGLRRAFGRMPPAPPSTAWLASAPPGVVMELPWEYNRNSLYMYWSTAHWRPLVNGAASFAPRGNEGLGALGNRWPTPYIRNQYQAAGITYVVVHLNHLTDNQRERLRAAALPAGVRCLAALGDDRVYGFAEGAPAGPPGSADCGD